MAAETQEALKEQEKRLGLLIGRLEVGTARRQAILSKQDATLQNLQVCNEKTQHYKIYRYVIRIRGNSNCEGNLHLDVLRFHVNEHT